MNAKRDERPGQAWSDVPDVGRVGSDSPLHPIVEEAYRVFAYPKPSTTGVCERCCMDPRIERDFHSPAIRELPLAYLRDWFFAVPTPALTREVWGYLLPRVMEVLACGESPSNAGIELSLSRFPTGDRQRWSDAEWDVLDRFRTTFLDHGARRSEDFLDDLLCLFGEAGWSLAELLDQASAWPDELLAERLWNDWCRRLGKRDIWITAFWSGAHRARVFAFYTSRELYERMEDLGLDDGTPAALSERALAVADTIRENADRAAGSSSVT